MTDLGAIGRPLLILRSEPGASATARRAHALGLVMVVAPLFTVRALVWRVPNPSHHDAVMMTSANAARLGGPQLSRYAHLPAFAVGASTADAMRRAGFADVETTDGDADMLVARVARTPHRRLLHLCGEDHRAVRHPTLAIDHVPVYAAIAVDELPPHAAVAMRRGAAALLHSPRAAALLTALADAAAIDRSATALVAISLAAATAAGPGWRSVSYAAAPTDAAMLAIARDLCENLVR